MSLAEVLRAHHEAILSRWTEEVERALALPEGSQVELRDHVPELLRQLVEALDQGGARSRVVAPARANGQQRLRLHFSLEAVVREYGLLRKTVMAVLREVGFQPSLDEMDCLGTFLEEGMAQAVAWSTREKDAEEVARAVPVERAHPGGDEVTEQVRARHRMEALAREVQAAEAQLRFLMDALPVLVSFVTADERYGFANKAYETWFGQSREQLLGKTLREVIGEAAYAALGPYVRRGLAGESFSFEQHGVPYRLGGTRDVKVSFVSHRDTAGQPDGYIALLEDISARRRLEAERDRLASQRSEVLESMGDAFFALDHQWRFTLVNRHQERRSSTRREDLLGHVLWEVSPRWAESSSPHGLELHRCMEQRVAVQFIAHSGSPDVWTDVRAFPTSDGGIAVFSRDVSREKQVEELLKRQSDFERQLIGIVSHDLRNPLMAIQMGATLLTQRDELSERSLKSVVRIQSAVGRAIRLVKDLLDFTQARLGGGLPIQPRPGELHALTRAVLEEVSAAHPEREVRLHTEGDGAGDWDMDRLGQMIQNLVTNALKYSPEETLVQVETRGGTAGVTLSVHNQGVPIAPERLQSIFQPMQRGDVGADAVGGSVGLGLYIVQSIVRAHGGTIEVSSQAATGTRFTVRLPRRAPR